MQQNEQKELHGWSAITAHLGLTREVIIQRQYPVYKVPFSQGVYAFAQELDAHTKSIFAERKLIKVTPKKRRNRTQASV